MLGMHDGLASSMLPKSSLCILTPRRCPTLRFTSSANNLFSLNFNANTSLNPLPHSPSFSPLVFAKYLSRPPNLSIVLRALVDTLALINVSSVSLYSLLFERWEPRYELSFVVIWVRYDRIESSYRRKGLVGSA